MDSIPKELKELVERFLLEDAESGFFNILDSPEHWNYDYFLNLVPLLEDKVERLAVLAPEFVAKGRHKEKTDKPPRYSLIAKNILDTVITLPLQIAHHKNLPVSLMLFNSNKEDSNVLFINAAQRFQTEKGKEMVQAAQINKIIATYSRVRIPQVKPSTLSSPVCYVDQFNEIKPGVIVDRYAYLATVGHISRMHFSVSPADYIS